MSEDNKKSIDDFFEEIYGHRPVKKGTAYELIVSAAFKLIDSNKEVFSDQRLRGAYSKQLYQIDTLIKEGGKTFVESKDYSEKSKPVGRPDVSKLAGALSDLDVQSGAVASATSFTKPAKDYAKSSQGMILGKSIDLFHIRPSTIEDEKGRIKTIIVNLTFSFAAFERAKWQPSLTIEAQKKLQLKYPVGTSMPLHLDKFYNSSGDVVETVRDLSERLNGLGGGDQPLIGSFGEGMNLFIKVEETLYGLIKLDYEIPFDKIEQTLKIQQEGNAALLVKKEDGSLDKILTDLDLKRVIFETDGKITLNPKK